MARELGVSRWRVYVLARAKRLQRRRENDGQVQVALLADQKGCDLRRVGWLATLHGSYDFGVDRLNNDPNANFLSNRWVAMPLGIVVAAISALVIRDAQQPLPVAPRDQPTVAVLAFPGPDRGVEVQVTELLSRAIADEDVSMVPPSQVAEAIANLDIRPQEQFDSSMWHRLTRLAGADYYVTGRISNSSSSSPDALVTITIALRDRGGDSLATETRARSADDLIGLVSELATLIRRRLGVRAVSENILAASRSALPRGAALGPYLRALDLLRRAEFWRALAALDIAAKADPDHPAIHLAIAEVWLRLGQYANAKLSAEHAAQSSHLLSRDEQLVVRGLVERASFRWDEATKTYTALFQRHPRQLQYGLMLFSTQLRARRPANELSGTIADLRKSSEGRSAAVQIDIHEAQISSLNPERRISLLKEAIADAEASGAQSEALAGKYQLCLVLVDVDPAVAGPPCEDSLAAFRALNHRLGTVQALNALGRFAQMNGDMDRAITLFRDAASQAIEQRFEHEAGVAAANLSNVFGQMLSPSEAMKYAAVAEVSFQKSGDPMREGFLFENTGTTFQALGELRRAKDYFIKAISALQRSNIPGEVAIAQSNLAYTVFGLGEVERAIQLLRQAIPVVEHYNVSGAYPRALLTLSGVLHANGALQESKAYAERALGQDERFAFAFLGVLAVENNDANLARSECSRWIKQFPADQEIMAIDGIACLAAAEELAGNQKAATAAAEKLLKYADLSGNRMLKAMGLTAVASAAIASENYSAATPQIAELAQIEDIQVLPIHFAARLAMVRHDGGLGRFDRAIAMSSQNALLAGKSGFRLNEMEFKIWREVFLGRRDKKKPALESLVAEARQKQWPRLVQLAQTQLARSK